MTIYKEIQKRRHPTYAGTQIPQGLNRRMFGVRVKPPLPNSFYSGLTPIIGLHLISD